MIETKENAWNFTIKYPIFGSINLIFGSGSKAHKILNFYSHCWQRNISQVYSTMLSGDNKKTSRYYQHERTRIPYMHFFCFPGIRSANRWFLSQSANSQIFKFYWWQSLEWDTCRRLVSLALWIRTFIQNWKVSS